MTRTKNNKTKESGKAFTTYDMACAAALITAGFELVALDKSNPRKVQFVFDQDDKLEKVIADFWADRLKVNARVFFDNIKLVKNRIYSE